MKRAGQWLIMIPLTIFLLIWAFVLTATLLGQSFGILAHPEIILLVVMVYLAIPEGALWIAGWIVEGFAKNPN